MVGVHILGTGQIDWYKTQSGIGVVGGGGPITDNCQDILWTHHTNNLLLMLNLQHLFAIHLAAYGSCSIICRSSLKVTIEIKCNYSESRCFVKSVFMCFERMIIC